jgi:hypothetical protein
MAGKVKRQHAGAGERGDDLKESDIPMATLTATTKTMRTLTDMP